MGKVGLISAKYIIHAELHINGVVDKPDVIGAIFGQTEGLLGSDLELRELQRSGRIGRIEVTTDVRGGKTTGEIIIPSSLDKAETAIIAAALEIIERIGPCNAKIKVTNIEDVRFTKRQYVVERAKQLLKEMLEKQIPDSQELSEEVAHSVRMMEIKEYGKERLPAGPAVDESDEVIVVEGRADVLNLLKHGIKNVIAMNGTSVPNTIIELSKRKIITAFVDGDRGGDLILKELLGVADIDYVAKAPDGKEVEEITKKEIHKALRSKVSIEQARHELGLDSTSVSEHQHSNNRAMTKRGFYNKDYKDYKHYPQPRQGPRQQQAQQSQHHRARKKIIKFSDEEKSKIREMLEDLIGTRGAYLLDDNLTILGKVPILELPSVLKETKGVYTVIMDGTIDNNLLSALVKYNVKRVIAMSSKADEKGGIELYTYKDL